MIHLLNNEKLLEILEDNFKRNKIIDEGLDIHLPWKFSEMWTFKPNVTNWRADSSKESSLIM